jgi:hypothetical protein
LRINRLQLSHLRAEPSNPLIHVLVDSFERTKIICLWAGIFASFGQPDLKLLRSLRQPGYWASTGFWASREAPPGLFPS